MFGDLHKYHDDILALWQFMKKYMETYRPDDDQYWENMDFEGDQLMRRNKFMYEMVHAVMRYICDKDREWKNGKM